MVPKTIDDETVVRVAQFRQYGRFPVLSYYHKDNGVRYHLKYIGSHAYIHIYFFLLYILFICRFDIK